MNIVKFDIAINFLLEFNDANFALKKNTTQRKCSTRIVPNSSWGLIFDFRLLSRMILNAACFAFI